MRALFPGPRPSLPLGFDQLPLGTLPCVDDDFEHLDEQRELTLGDGARVEANLCYGYSSNRDRVTAISVKVSERIASKLVDSFTSMWGPPAYVTRPFAPESDQDEADWQIAAAWIWLDPAARVRVAVLDHPPANADFVEVEAGPYLPATELLARVVRASREEQLQKGASTPALASRLSDRPLEAEQMLLPPIELGQGETVLTLAADEEPEQLSRFSCDAALYGADAGFLAAWTEEASRQLGPELEAQGWMVRSSDDPSMPSVGLTYFGPPVQEEDDDE